jgi:hypothetical protein
MNHSLSVQLFPPKRNNCSCVQESPSFEGLTLRKTLPYDISAPSFTIDDGRRWQVGRYKDSWLSSSCSISVCCLVREEQSGRTYK